MALASITVTTGVTVDGRTLARTAAVTLDTDTITRPVEGPPPVVTAVSTTTSLISSANPTVVNQAVTFTATVTASSGTAIPAGLVVFTDRSVPIGIGTLDSTGRVTFTTSTLAVGTRVIRAAYVLTPGFSGSVSPRILQVIS
jgi:hypothetical protein